ncbi:hypothetical protein DAPPUDRAFT_267307 [Daphnia pulex]|uniref:Uncharacterized protein n=1 Tax=Daphnia pulex TaxID=6669 RepID=E9HWA7_DAPPU|nr:hypothetical protein DAPPUDRAFT_267307 [Daphnia pulex]|eukprot:EFX63973.1 hypothetical protein DAPPUDRAFT_267307 [Daphnia pulex]
MHFDLDGSDAIRPLDESDAAETLRRLPGTQRSRLPNRDGRCRRRPNEAIRNHEAFQNISKGVVVLLRPLRIFLFKSASDRCLANERTTTMMSREVGHHDVGVHPRPGSSPGVLRLAAGHNIF